VVEITRAHLDQLIDIESRVHYGIPPPPGVAPFVAVRRPSRVLLSAPHGARTFRHCETETWHEEDEYTASMALLLSELCGTSVVATIWRTDDCDPNYQYPCPYKDALAALVRGQQVRWVIDLHGASRRNLKRACRVDLGSRKDLCSLPQGQLDRFEHLLEKHLGADTVSHNRFHASAPRRTITAYSHEELGIHAVQVEMVPSVRVPRRRLANSTYEREGPWIPRPARVMSMMQALADFIEGLQVADVEPAHHT
jgi:hypothetical protein